MLVVLETMASREYLLPRLTKNTPPSTSRHKGQCSHKQRSKLSRRFQQKWGRRNRANQPFRRMQPWIFSSSMMLSNKHFPVRNRVWRTLKRIALINLYPAISTRSSSQLHKEIHSSLLPPLVWAWMLHPSASPLKSLQAGPISQTSPRPRPIYQCRCVVRVSRIIRHLIPWCLDHNCTSLRSNRTYKETRRNLM